ncbi:DNA -binding domain-containing protein [Sphingosinicella rhizophila]|uniref:DUF2285 domain-containing protein n=1 Tax=Sphingosinicella rhizophila TaxID=3050082 RepID=A0ABU3Q986_9SPHN|nr:DUF2285 domain-containing protein [Sphingosinicella sp. GR2756]MDT9599867.1 DUF2285 domain-containing protein [Sphingosinicella sp. GR2756]
MRPEDRQAADWREAAAYAPLLAADRSILAWEWLRRDPGYRAAADRALGQETQAAQDSRTDAGEWGLHAFEPAEIAAPAARPVWRSGFHPYVLEADALPTGDARNAFELARVAGMSTIVVESGQEHLLVSDGLRAVRLDLLSGSVRRGPVRLHYRLAGLASAERPLLTLRRLLALWRAGRFSAQLHPVEARAARFVLMLRAHDALAAGATQREIAAVLLSGEAGEARWRVRAPTVRSQVQRLVRSARFMAAGGYLALLGGEDPLAGLGGVPEAIPAVDKTNR